MITEQNCTMLCDFYQLTMGNGYFKSKHKDTIAYFDVFFRRVPDNGGFAVCAGLEQVIGYIENLRFNPVELIIALDDNYESQGKLFIDDGENVDRLYYKMDFVSLYDDKNKNIELIFKKVYESFTIPEKWFPYIERVTIYGIGNAPSRVTYFRGGDDEKDIPKEKIKYDTNKKVLVIELQSEQILKSKNNTIRFILEGIIKE